MSYANTLNSKWYAGLRAELKKEVKLAVRKACREGNKDFGVVANVETKHVSKNTLNPIFEMFASTDEKYGRSYAYHAEVLEEKIVRHELGMSLWSEDEADTSDSEMKSVRLSDNDFAIMGRLMKIADETKLSSLRK